MRRSGIKRRRKPLREAASGVIARQAHEAWFKGARSKPCANCGIKRGIIRGHHIVYQQTIKRIVREGEGSAATLDSLLWDDRNRLPLCDPCHEHHHNGSRRLSIAIVKAHAPKVFQFARELDRNFGVRGAEPALMALEREYVW